MTHQQAEPDVEDNDIIIDSLMLQKAEQGDPVAQLKVGKTYYFFSDYTESNRLNTFDWISRSANQGNLEAQFILGDLHALGWGTKQCRTSAYDWYTKAAIQGYKKALIRIHNLYQEGIRMHCRGQLNDGEEEWSNYDFKEENNVREINEYRLHIYKSILNGAVDYCTRQFEQYKASNQEDPDVQQYLGFFFQHGYGTRKYISVAINYYTKAAEQGLVAAQYNLGFLYQQNTKIKFNYRKAFHWYTLAAEGGNVAAQNGLAYFYEKGLAADVNYLTALHWYTEAANSGHSGAQITLGKWYRKGQCVEQDYAQAAEWYRLAASQGSQVAQNCLDLLYQNGNIAEETVPEYSTGPSRRSRLCSKLRLDIELLDNDSINTEQIKKLAMNASKGDGNAMYEIGLNYYNGTDFTQDKDISFKWIRNAANTGHKEAQFKLAEMYKEGDVVEQNYHKRSIWTKRLAKKKDDVARYNLGMLYRRGLGVREDGLEASKWFILSSDHGNIDALYELAKMKEHGFSFKPNKKEAVDLYYKLAIGGNINACTELARICVEGDGEVEQDRVRGLKMYDYAARQGDTKAQFALGEIYERGEYIEADYSKTSRYYSMIPSTDRCGSDFSLADKYLNGRVLTRDNKKAFFRFKMDEMGLLKKFRSRLFQPPIAYDFRITNYYNLIDMFIEVTECGIDNLEYNIGYTFEHGIYSEAMEEVFTKDYKKALKWYSISASKEDSRALYRLGLMYEEGKGAKKNLGIALDYYLRAAENDNVDAKYRLGCMHLIGYSIPQDMVKAFYLFTSAANMGYLKSRKVLMLLDDIEEMNSAGDRFAQDRDISFTEKDQLRMLEAVADEGLVAIQYQLGILYQNKGDPKALKWLTLAARGGTSDACYRLGVLYEEGIFAKPNYERAIELYETALKGDHEDAIYRLAKLHQFGKCTPIDYIKAYDLYIQASEMGHLLSFKNLNITGDQYKYSTDTTHEVTFDTTSQEYQQSILMCEHVAEQGNTELQYKLGIAYEDHLKEPNYSNALKWYKMAASNSQKEATYRLGLLYEKGLGVDQDYKEAIRLFEQARDMNNSSAILRLGRAYQYGCGVDADSNKAIEHYTLAADLGNLKSQHTLGEIYERGSMTERNILVALKWYTKAYSRGYDAARSNLFDMYEDTPYEVFFERKLCKAMQTICSTGLSEGRTTIGAINNYHMACTRVGYWHYQHGDSKLAWKYFSDSLKAIVHPGVENFINCKCIDLKDRNDILDSLQTQTKLVEGLDDSALYNLGKSYYKGVFEEPTKKKVKRSTEEHGSRGNEDLNTRRNVILKQDYTKALFFFKKLAEKGHHGAQYHLGKMYHYGFGVKVDLGRARELYDKAATGNGGYTYKVGMVYHCDGELQDFSKAVKCYGKSEIYLSNLMSGICYLFGTGVEKDYKKAIEHLKEYIFGQILPPLFYLGFAYYNGPSDIRDYSRAFRLFQKVVESKSQDENKMILHRFKSNSKYKTLNEEYSFTLELESVFQGESYYYIGIMYTKGQGTTQNKREAKKCFSKAVEHGNEQAKQYIG